MPLLLLPVLAGALGFGGGFWAANGLDKLAKFGVVVGVGYLIFIKVAK